MASMFEACVSLASLDLSSFDTSNVTDMKKMFKCCYQKTVGYEYNNSLTELDLTSFHTEELTDMQSMFMGLQGLVTLNFSSNFSTANVTTMKEQFYMCKNLTAIDLSGFDTSNVTAMDYMFTSCSNLLTLDLTAFNTSNVTTMHRMFTSCSKLTGIDFGSNFDTSNVTDMERMFQSCGSLTSLDVSNFDTSSVTTMAYMFASCSKIPELNLLNFDTSNVLTMERMFDSFQNNCNEADIVPLNLASFDTSNVTNMRDMFINATKTVTICVSDAFVTTSVVNSSSMFKNCLQLTGEAGTPYNSEKMDAEYARIDDPDNGNPGYFTEIPKLAKVGTKSCYSRLLTQLKMLREQFLLCFMEQLQEASWDLQPQVEHY